jgi:hypothetical protein
MHVPTYSISIDGNDVTSNFDPLLITLRIVDTDGGKADTFSCELDDADGHIELPRIGAVVQAGMGWSDSGSVVMFNGFVDEVRSTGARGQGHLLQIDAKSANMRDNLKQPAQRHKDNAKFSDVATQWGQAAGLSSVKVDDAIGSIQRAYWAMGHESFLVWGTRIAKELGATFKIMGGTGVFVKRSSGTSTSGKPLTPINAVYGDNLISWSLAPVLSRPEYQKFLTRWYDTKAAKWMSESVDALSQDSASGGVTAQLSHKRQHANKDNASNQSGSNSIESDRDKGGGTVTIQGNPDAASQAPCIVSGVRPGVDGTYRIETATHDLTRGKSYTTELALKQPSGSAGTDSRGAPGGSSGSATPGGSSGSAPAGGTTP